MAATTEEIVIEFTAEYSSLDGAVDVLEKAGAVDSTLANSFKKTTAEFNKQEKAVKGLGQALKGPITSIDQLDKRSRKFVDDFVKGFEEGVKAELLSAKSEIDAMRAKLENAGKTGGGAVKSLKQQLKEMTAEIAAAKASGGPVSQDMINKAGELKDAIADANSAIAQAGSDTRGLDAVLGSAQAIAGGFALVQGAAALFGDESEELQKTLLKVNAAMSVLQGLQSIQNALQKEGAIVQLGIIAQEKIYNAQLALEGATQSKNIIIKGAATVAQKALNAAVAVNPYLLIVSALLVVIPLILNFAENTREAAAANAELDSALRRSTESLADQIDFINDKTERQTIAAEKAGKSEVEILKIRKQGLIELHQERTRQFEENRAALAVIGGDEEKRAALEREQEKFRIQARKDQIAADKLNLDIQKAQQKELDDAKQKSEEQRKKNQEKKARDLQDSIADVKRELLTADETKQSYKTLQIALINLQAQYDSLGKTIAEVKLIQTQANIDVAKIADPIFKNFKTPLDESQKAIGDTTKALAGFAQDANVVITATIQTTEETFGQFLERVIPQIQDGLQAIGNVGNSVNAIFQEQQDNAQINIDNQKAQTDELLKSGAITEKEAIARQNRLAQQEKILRRKQAQREKDAAIFSAVINVAQSITKAFTAGPVVGQVLAGVIAALGLAQIAAITARPIPNFRTGKKSKWEGLGRYGEAGAELRVNADGQMEYATKPTVKYIGPDDVIFTPQETRDIMTAANARPMREIHSNANNNFQIDYDALGLAIGKNNRTSPVSINIDKRFIREEVRAGLANKTWFDERYSFRK